MLRCSFSGLKGGEKTCENDIEIIEFFFHLPIQSKKRLYLVCIAFIISNNDTLESQIEG